jgi:hypothetical protein
MSRYDHADERDLYRGLVVQEYGPEDVGLLEYLRARSPVADAKQIDSGVDA